MLFLKALSVFLGTMIGVGIFGLPFIALKAGFLAAFFYFILMTAIAIIIHFIYAEIVLGTRESRHLPGYAGEYLGETWKKITFFVIAVGLMGALLAYLIIGGDFLAFFLSSYFGGSSLFYTLLFFAIGAYLIFRDIKTISQIELILLFILFAILFIFLIRAFPLIDVANFKGLNLNFIFLPYGVILFSFWASSVVPEIEEMFIAGFPKAKNKVRSGLKKVIFWGTIISAFVYIVFTALILGVSGLGTSEEAISGLSPFMGENIIKLGFVFGVISCFTSFLTLGLVLKKTLWYDFGLPKNLSWLIACFLPLIFFLLGMREFLDVISFTGAISLGLEGIIIVFLYKGFLKKKFSRKMNPFLYLLAAVFFLGIIFEIIYLL